MQLKIHSENSTAESQICFLCSTPIIKCTDSMMAQLNSHCFGLWEIWLKVQAPAVTFIVEIVYLKKKHWGLWFYIFAHNDIPWFKKVKEFVLILGLSLNIDSYIRWSSYCYFKDRHWVNNPI